MADIRISQEVVETLALPTPNVRVTQEVVESLALPTPVERVSQLVVETLASVNTQGVVTGSGGIIIGGSGNPVGTYVSNIITGTGGIVMGGSGTPSGTNIGPAAAIRFTQEVIETVAAPVQGVQFTQFVIEVPVRPVPPPIYFTQDVIETVAAPANSERFTQVLIETVARQNFVWVPPDPGGRTGPGINPTVGGSLCGSEIPLAFVAIAQD